MFKRLAALMIVLIFSGSIASTAEESQVKTNIIAEAIADVMRDAYGMSGAVIGHFFNRIGSDSVGTRAGTDTDRKVSWQITGVCHCLHSQLSSQAGA